LNTAVVAALPLVAHAFLSKATLTDPLIISSKTTFSPDLLIFAMMLSGMTALGSLFSYDTRLIGGLRFFMALINLLITMTSMMAYGLSTLSVDQSIVSNLALILSAAAILSTLSASILLGERYN
jgi:hypothetical protein